MSHEVRRVLAVYLERGREALASFAAEADDDAAAHLSARTAAFHNLRALTARAEAAGYDGAADPEARAIWTAIQEVDRQLCAATCAAHERAVRQFHKVREARRTIGSYRSGMDEPPRFAKTA